MMSSFNVMLLSIACKSDVTNFVRFKQHRDQRIKMAQWSMALMDSIRSHAASHRISCTSLTLHHICLSPFWMLLSDSSSIQTVARDLPMSNCRCLLHKDNDRNPRWTEPPAP